MNEKEIMFYDVIIIGGGLAGLTSAIHLAKFDKKVLLIEKNEYPKHKVCGEYISNEVLPYLKYLDVNPFDFGAKKINRLLLSTVKSNVISCDLPLGGFGISRFTLDHLLVKKAIANGVSILQDTVTSVQFKDDVFTIRTKLDKEYQSRITLGTFGKRSLLDVKMDRDFIKKKSPYLAVKMHVKGKFPEDLVALHNFKGGYCGVSTVENNALNLCYIVTYKEFKKYKNITDFQDKVLYQNQFLKEIFLTTTPLFKNPITISQISFATKKPVANHILMCGDSAGMIHPLCGNGMSMAISASQIATKLVIQFLDGQIKSRSTLEKIYIKKWNTSFKSRLETGHLIAKVFRQQKLSEIALYLLRKLPFILPKIISRTHGKTIKI